MCATSLGRVFARLVRCVSVILILVLSLGANSAYAETVISSDHPAPVLGDRTPPPARTWTPFLEDLEHRAFRYFWDTANPDNGLIPDRWPGRSPASVAAVGFGLTAYGVGVHRGYITRAQAVDRTLKTLRFLATSSQGRGAGRGIGHRGFYYHFLDMHSGKRDSRSSELSTVDTALLMGGVLFAQSFYDRDTPREHRIRALADRLYRRIDWPWAQNDAPLISIGWRPQDGFNQRDWFGYSEAMLVYIMALGSPSHPVQPQAWQAWSNNYSRAWGCLNGQKQLAFAPLFGHQYSHIWVDFRGIRDAFMRRHDMDYFQNSRRAAYAQRAYAIDNPGQWRGYGKNVWGFTASQGPGQFTHQAGGRKRAFFGYMARGVTRGQVVDDGTIAPTAAGGSVAFAPKIAIPALETMQRRYGRHIYGRYGFFDAFNPSLRDPDAQPRFGHIVPGTGWVTRHYLGIDEGPILLMLENYRSGFVWRVMRRNPNIRRGLQKAGFDGGWLGTDR